MNNPHPISLRTVSACLIAAALSAAATTALADVESGPLLNEPVPELKVLALTGEQENKELDYATERAAKPTVYALVRADRFDRPMARLLKALDGDLGKAAGAAVVAVWLAPVEEHARLKEHLPRVQQSLKLEKTALCLYGGDANGPNHWGVNTDADVTFVVVKDKKPTARWGFISANEMLAKQVREALNK